MPQGYAVASSDALWPMLHCKIIMIYMAFGNAH